MKFSLLSALFSLVLAAGSPQIFKKTFLYCPGIVQLSDTGTYS